MIIKVFTHNKNGKEIVLFKCSVSNQNTYEVITDVGGVYENDFALALKGKFSIEVYTKNHESETIEIKGNNWRENIESYINYMERCYKKLGVFIYKEEVSIINNNQNNCVENIEICEDKTEIDKKSYLANNSNLNQYSIKAKSQGAIYGSAA